MSELTRPPARIPMVDPKTGQITREWYRFLDQTFQRLGGAQGQSITELTADLHDDAGIEEIKLELYRSRDDGNQAPPPQPQIIDDNQAPPGAFFTPADDPAMRIDALEAQVAELGKAVSTPEFRLEAIEAQLAELIKAINDIRQGGVPL